MKTFFATSMAAALLAFAACSGKDKAEKATAAPETAGIAESHSVMESASPLLRTDTLRSGGSVLTVSVNRHTDKELPNVRDENDQEFYDNCVEITVRSNGEELLNKRVTKADFSSHLGETEKRTSVLQGMALVPEKSSATTLTFGAQVGQPGLDGEGPAFTVVLDLPGGTMTVCKDKNQDTTRDDMTGEED